MPRPGSACPHSGTVPRVAAMGHPWPSAVKPASLPVYPLHRAYLRPSWLTGPVDQNQRPDQKRDRVQLCFSVGAGLPAMQTTRCIRKTQLMPSQASQLPHLTVPALAFDCAVALKHSSRPGGRCALAFALAFDLDLRRPVKPRWPNAGFGAYPVQKAR